MRKLGMNKRIVVGVTIAIIAIAASVVGVKTILGDKALELPGEEHTEKALNVQDTNNSARTIAPSNESGSTESTESGP